MSGLLSILFGALPSLLPQVKDLAEVFAGNKKERDKNQFDENVATKEAFGKEFSYSAPNRTRYDSFVDGINRLPRPLMALSVPALFVWCAISPDSFSRSMQALRAMPDIGWQYLMLISAFYFGARTWEKTRPSDGPSPTATSKTASPVATTGAAAIAEDWKAKATGGN